MTAHVKGPPEWTRGQQGSSCDGAAYHHGDRSEPLPWLLQSIEAQGCCRVAWNLHFTVILWTRNLEPLIKGATASDWLHSSSQAGRTLILI